MASKKKVEMENNQKDRWDKASIILRPMGGLLAALAVAGIGYFGSSYLNHRQDSETRMRLYTELISNREQAESALRKDMFTSIIGTFLKPETAKLDERVLQLELLAYNFHECLNLMPLFIHLSQQIENEDVTETARKSYRDRVHKVAKEITGKQVAVLEGAGEKQDIEIDFSETRSPLLREDIAHVSDTLIICQEKFDLQVAAAEDTIRRSYRLIVLDADTTLKEIKVRLEIRTPAGEFEDDEFDQSVTIISDSTDAEELSDVDNEDEFDEFPDNDFAVGDSTETDIAEEGLDFDEFPEGENVNFIEAKFWVGPFDFPMIDNTRLPNDQRCAVILKKFEYPEASLTVICFPGSHASLKEKPYYDEIVEKLLPKKNGEAR